MENSPQRGVVLLHGLPDDNSDRFSDLRPVERVLQEQGYQSLYFRWPEGFVGPRYLASAARSFSATLAEKLDEYLQREVAGKVQDRHWVVLAHSGGGLVFFRWLLDYSATFFEKYGTQPGYAFLFAAPHKCDLQEIRFPDGRALPVRGEELDPEAIGKTLPGRLLVFVARDDGMILPQDALFPSSVMRQGQVRQFLLEGITRRSVCSHKAAALEVKRLASSLP